MSFIVYTEFPFGNGVRYLFMKQDNSIPAGNLIIA